jgi:tetratricopeptide (TPR) repeat protein
LTTEEFSPIIGSKPYLLMSDPLSTHPVRASEPRGEADREARIEELLLSGLDHYFAGQYELAISVWTRIVFLDRHHDRARAYIERARGALAERQRESDECLHDGVVAYNAGEIDKARDLLTRAVQQGSDAAGVFLDRLNRLQPVGGTPDLHDDARPSRILPRRRRVPLAPRRGGWVAAAFAALAVAVMMLLGGLPIGTWLSELEGAPTPRATQPVAEEPLPVVRSSEMILARARSLYTEGHPRDALRALDRIGIADPAHAEADRLRAAIQRDLLTAAGIPGTSNVDANGRP